MTQINSQYQTRSVSENPQTQAQNSGAKKNTTGALAATVANDLNNIQTESKAIKELNLKNDDSLGKVSLHDTVQVQKLDTPIILDKSTHLSDAGGLSKEGKELVLKEFTRQYPDFGKHYDENSLNIRYNKSLADTFKPQMGDFNFCCYKKNDSPAKPLIYLEIDPTNLLKVGGINDTTLVSTLGMLADESKLQKYATNMDREFAAREKVVAAGERRMLGADLKEAQRGRATAAIASEGKRSYGWAVAIATVTAAITATVAAVGGILTHNGENKIEEANDNINSAEGDQGSAVVDIEKYTGALNDAKIADYDDEGIKAGNLAAQKQIDADMAQYLVAQGNGDTEKMKEIAGHYTVLPDGGTPDFSLGGLSQKGKDYIESYYTDGYNTGVTEARNEAVKNAIEPLKAAETSKTNADNALSNAYASKKSAEKMKAGGIATLAAGLPVVLMGGGLMAAANGYHVKKKNQVINANLRNIKEGNYDKMQSADGVGVHHLAMKTRALFTRA